MDLETTTAARIKQLENTKRSTLNKLRAVETSIEAANVELRHCLKEIEQKFLTRNQICDVLNITEPTLIKRRNAGKIPFIKLGKSFYYLRPEAQ